MKMIRLHHVNIRTSEVGHTIVVNPAMIVTVEPEGIHAKIVTLGDVGYFYVFESVEEVEDLVYACDRDSYLDTEVANLFFRTRGDDRR